MLELNKIYNIDCLDGMSKVDDKVIDLICVDLPYQVTHNSWDIIIPFKPMWEQFERIIKDNGNIILFGQDKFTAKLMLSNEKLHRYNLIWDKELTTGFLNASKQPLRSHEDICVFYKNQGTYNPQMIVGEKSHSVGKAAGTMNSDSFNNANYGDFKIRNTEGNLKYPKSIWTFQKPHPSVAIHPTQKPLDLCRYIIRTYSNKGDLVLDCCCGSGTIPMAAKMENRNYIGMDNGYCEKPNTEYDGKSWAEISTMRLKNVGKKLF
jgi:DNA modification methylase